MISKFNTYHIDARNEDGDSLLDEAIKHDELDSALFLINHGCGSDEDKVKLLCKACQQGELKMVKELVERHGVNPKGSF